MMNKEFYKGEHQCQHIQNNGVVCKNKAYYLNNDQLLCGVHSRKVVQSRIELNHNPFKKEILNDKLKHFDELAKSSQIDNRSRGQRGSVICSKIKMMKPIEDFDGYLKVFPNFKHKGRKDGLGYNELSPKFLGPVDHGQPSLPPALSIENYHQFNKVFNNEYDAQNDRILLIFFDAQKKAYQDSTPHRHKFKDVKGTKDSTGKTNKNIPLFSVHQTMDGKELRRFTYVQSRFFYSHQYELLVQNNIQFIDLKNRLNDGWNLQIVGYDGYPLTKLDKDETDVDMFYRFYLDDSRPFGHELVLCSMLVLDNSNDYPWNRYRSDHSHLYQGCVKPLH